MAKTKLDLSNDKDQHIDERLRTAPIIWLGSVRPDGRPHLVAVWFLWDGATILIFSIPNNQKLRNIMQNPNVTLAVDDSKGGDDPIVVEGQAELLPNGSVDTTLPTYAEKYATLLTEMGWSAATMATEYSQAIRVTPTRFMGV
jgi:PPOX class probable F420-dependent enzyme